MSEQPELQAVQDRPERVTVSTDIFEAMMNAVGTLPAAQAAGLYVAAQQDVKPFVEN